MNGTDVKKFYKKYMDADSGLSTEDVINKYENHMNSDKAFTNDELLELAEYMIYDSKLNELRLRHVDKRSSRSYKLFKGITILETILLDMTRRGVIFNVPMVTTILNDEKKSKRGCINVQKMLLNMIKNGYVITNIQYKKLNELCIGFPMKYFINNKFICNQNEFELLPFEYSKFEKDLKNIGKIKKIIRKSNVEITDKFIDNLHKGIENLHLDKRSDNLHNSFYAEFIRKIGNNKYQLKYEHLVSYLKYASSNAIINDGYMKIIMYYVKNIKDLRINIDIFLCCETITKNNTCVFHKFINEKIIHTSLRGKSEQFVNIISRMQFNNALDYKILNYFRPNYTDELFDYACIYQCTLVINWYLQNYKTKITKEKFDIACKSGHYTLVNCLLTANKSIKVTEYNVIDFALSLNKVNRNYSKICKSEILLINRMILITKISDNTKLMLMDMNICERDKKYEIYRDEINPIRKIIPRLKRNHYEQEIDEFKLPHSNNICSNFRYASLEHLALKITQQDVDNKCFMSIVVSNRDNRILNYLEYKYNFVPTYHQILNCTILKRRVHLLNKYYPQNN